MHMILTKLTMEYGVVASFVLLLSTVVSEQRDLNAASDDIINTFHTQEELDSVLIMNLPFAESLTNPCSWASTYSGVTPLNSMSTREKYIKEFFRSLSQYSETYKEDVQAILKYHTFAGCAELHIRNLPDTPTLEELKEMDMEEALNKIYLSLLVHSAYSFVVHYQVNSSYIRCPDNIQGDDSLANESYTLALKQKTLACYVLLGISYLGYEQQDVTPLLNVTISDLSDCTRRDFRSCQVMHSAQRLFQELQSYANDYTKCSKRLLNSISFSVSHFTSSMRYCPSSMASSPSSMASSPSSMASSPSSMASSPS